MSIKAKAIEWILRGVVSKNKIHHGLAMIAVRKKAEEISKEVFMEGNVEGKNKWKSKAVWTAIVGGILSMVGPVSTALGHPIVVPTWAYEVLGAFGLYSLRTGIGKPLE